MTAFLMTWTEKGWPHENILRMLQTIASTGSVDEPWRIKAHRRAKIGDRVWVLKQGAGPKGIFGIGEISGIPFRSTENGLDRWRVPVRINRLVDPRKHILIGEPELSRILENKVRAQASGEPISESQDAALYAAFQFQAEAKFGGSPPAMWWSGAPNLDQLEEKVARDFNPTNIKDAREKVLASIVRRRGQKAFRNTLLVAYEGKCAITNCQIPELLDAAHIHPYKGEETNDVRNGILLRTDLHTLFDLGLIAIDTASWSVVIAKRLAETNYGQFEGRKFRRPKEFSKQPSIEALNQHRTETRL
ncbi:HNH endonuclease [Paramagnetospirillum magnetotacticum]|uniref:HNH endonuclease n=1 Tax=Paramagnetospirillum magnetotacticum TaxID=188 RepID=UPI0009E38461|nr:HNH endonuclease signature motif containing protein [Paramagnetospirillum magnetotacticum]